MMTCEIRDVILPVNWINSRLYCSSFLGPWCRNDGDYYQNTVMLMPKI